jgi:hypothetical protein
MIFNFNFAGMHDLYLKQSECNKGYFPWRPLVTANKYRNIYHTSQQPFNL